jgi:3-oxoacyl-(acyl-carrier-protein) synthase
MNDIFIAAASLVTAEDLASARLGARFGRLDLQSQLALFAVESLCINFDKVSRERTGISLAARWGSLSTDVVYWKGRDAVGGPSPTLFAYTLPSAAVGEIAIRHRLTGPNFCFVGDDTPALAEAVEALRRGEMDACVCVSCEVLTPEAARFAGAMAAAGACALFLKPGQGLIPLPEFDRDMRSLFSLVSARNTSQPALTIPSCKSRLTN